MGEDYLRLLNYLTIGNNEELFTLSQLHLWITKQALPDIATNKQNLQTTFPLSPTLQAKVGLDASETAPTLAAYDHIDSVRPPN